MKRTAFHPQKRFFHPKTSLWGEKMLLDGGRVKITWVVLVLIFKNVYLFAVLFSKLLYNPERCPIIISFAFLIN